MKHPAVTVSVAALVCLAPVVRAEDAGAASPQLVADECDATFALRFNLKPLRTAGWIRFNQTRPDTYHELSLKEGSATLVRVAARKRSELHPAVPLPPVPAEGLLSVTLLRHSDGIELLASGRRLARVDETGVAGGTATAGGEAIDSPRYQPTAPIVFTDDFMRDDGSQGAWIPRAGTWKLGGVNELNTVRDPRRGLRKAVATKSANAFHYAASDERCLATSGYWFWHDYTISAAVCPKSAEAVGLVAYAQHNGDGLRFEWGRDATGRNVCRVVQRLGGKETVVATRRKEAPATSPFVPSQWYLLQLAVRGDEARAYLDGRLVCEAKGVRLAIGPAGLWTTGCDEGGLAATFDDVFVESTASGNLAPRAWDAPFEITDTFTNDPFMTEWATAVADWRRRDDWWIHRGLFHGEVAVEMPAALIATPRSIRLTEDAASAGEYRVMVGRVGDDVRVQLSRNGDVVDTQQYAWDDSATLEVARGQAGLTVRLGEATCLTHKLPPPAAGLTVSVGEVAASDLTSVRVGNAHVLDTAFARAPVEWWAARGDWGLTQRWACSPEWSFFGGAESLSSPSPLLWSKDRFEGDQIIEFFAATQYTGKPERTPSDLNVAFCADGGDLSSGYNFIFAGGGQKFNRLLRGDRILAEQPFGEKKSKPHQMWHHVQVEKHGAQIRALVDGKQIVDLRDPDPLPGGHIGLWTYNGGLVVTRFRVWPERRLPGVPRYLPRATGPVGEGMGNPTNDFETGLGSWTAGDDAERPALTLDAATAFRGKQSLRVTNVTGGGYFCVWATKEGFSPTDLPVVRFAYKLQPKVKVNLYAQVNGWWREITMTLSGFKPGSKRVLGAIEGIVADGQWHEAEFDLLAGIKSLGMTSDRMAVQTLAFAAPDVDYIRAGLEGNPLGATYWIDEFRLEAGKADA